MSDGPTFARIDLGSNNNNNNNNNGDNNGNDADGANFDPWVTGPTEGGNDEGGANNNFTETQIQAFREQERRQRSSRSFMMFLLMMMLMDGEEQSQQRRQRQHKAGQLRGTGTKQNRNIDNINSVETDMELYRARRTQDRSIEDIVLHGNHSRVNQLIQRNDGNDFDRKIRGWAEEQRNIQTRVFYEQILKDLVLEQPDGSYVKVLVASSSNNEAVKVVNDPSQLLHDAEKPADDLNDAVKKFDEFLDAEQEVWHYPWNATGYYRGDWKLVDTESMIRKQEDTKGSTSTTSTPMARILSPVEAETPLLEHLQHQVDPSIGVHVLPPGMLIASSTNRTVIRGDNRKETPKAETPGGRTSGSTNSNVNPRGPFSLRGGPNAVSSSPLPAKLSLTQTSGKVAFQLYSKAVPAMKEISLIGGYIKLSDSNSVGYSTRKDILLKVHGVLIHSLGRLSLVANPQSTERVALLVGDLIGKTSNTSAEQSDKTESTMHFGSENENGRRKLQELLSLTTDEEGTLVNDFQIEEIRNEALNLFGVNDVSDMDLSSYERIGMMEDEDSTVDLHTEYMLSHRRLEQESIIDGSTQALNDLEKQRRLEVSATNVVGGEEDIDGQHAVSKEKNSIDSNTSDKPSNLIYSKHVVPFPFAWDDENKSLQQYRTPGSTHSLSAQEKSLEANAGSCEFEINLDVQEEKWTVRQWKKLMSKYTDHELADSRLATKFQDASTVATSEMEKSREEVQRKTLFQKSSGPSSSKSKKRASMEQAWVMAFNGTIVSPNCNFKASINSTAIRTDWEATAGKAINYAFYMMTICLTQIVLLLRQLLHTQTQSASARVSLLCIGWQTVIDALICLGHIYFSLAMQPLFTAFASVAFFKLLIFCVIEMKYMAIIIQARNDNNGGNSTELLRRQVAMLHVRFYAALMGSCLGFFYSDNYRTLYMLLLYSFWVPQIVHNVVTEAKKPMHPYYICGMSLTRLVVPLYMFANEGNFLKEVYPESPIDPFMCQLLVLWVGIQTGVLYAQSQFGARFFIPAQFLPPKYDYNRPIPACLLQQDNGTTNPSEQLQNERDFPKTEVRSLVRDLDSRGGVARNRKEGKRTKGETVMTAETLTEAPKCSSSPCIECVICYNNVDTSDRPGYMIAPCNHVFHKDCLVQWMEVKMECPICRHNLPAL